METITLRAFLKKNVCFKKAVLLLYNIDIRRADQIYDCPSPKIKIPLPNVHCTIFYEDILRVTRCLIPQRILFHCWFDQYFQVDVVVMLYEPPFHSTRNWILAVDASDDSEVDFGDVDAPPLPPKALVRLDAGRNQTVFVIDGL